MELKLNVYNEKEEVIKTHTRKTYSIKMGLFKKIVNVFETDDFASKIGNGDKITSNLSLISLFMNLASGSYNVIEDLMLSIFPELTEEEYENTDLKEVIKVIRNLFINTFNSISELEQDTKN